MNTAVVVAHPDDEVLWAGGYLAAHPGTDVICCTVPQRAPERCLVFFRVCQMLGANGIIAADSIDIAGESVGLLKAAQRMAKQYDQIITHNRIGEYRHPHHMAVHWAMRNTGVPMKVFGYGLTTDGDPVSSGLKRTLLTNYTTQPKCFEVWSRKFDLSKEAFLECQ